MHTFCPAHTQTSKLHRMDDNARIESAITDLESQSRLNYSAIAKKWGIERTTLSRRYRGQTGTRQEAASYTSKAYRCTRRNSY
jgi:transposase-like protein